MNVIYRTNMKTELMPPWKGKGNVHLSIFILPMTGCISILEIENISHCKYEEKIILAVSSTTFPKMFIK